MALTVTILLVALLGPVYAQQKGWEKEWNEAMAGGKKEGKVVVATSPETGASLPTGWLGGPIRLFSPRRART